MSPSLSESASPAGASSFRRWLASLLLAVLATALVAPPAFAHTFLESSAPSEGAVLGAPFSRVELTFTKGIELLPDTLRITDQEGRRVVTAIDVERSADGLVVSATLEPPLYAGAWRAHWRILASDSHPREGVIAVTVDQAVQPPTPATDTAMPRAGSSVVGAPRPSAAAVALLVDESSRFPTKGAFEVLGSIARVLYYLGLMVAVGLAFFKAGPHRGEAANAQGLARAVALGAGVGIFGGILEVLAHAGALADKGLAGVVDPGTWSAILRTGLGTALVLRVAGLGILLVGGLRRARRDVPSGPDGLKLAGAVMVIASFQFVGHTASTAPEWIIRVSDVLHVTAAAVWVGGLVGLAMLSGHADRLGRARTAARFSTAASVAVAAVAVAGSAMAFLTIPTVTSLFTTTYGQLLIAKLALVGMLAALGAHNHFKVVPRLADGDTEALEDLRRTVGLEVVVVLVVIVLTALLINTTPV